MMKQFILILILFISSIFFSCKKQLSYPIQIHNETPYLIDEMEISFGGDPVNLSIDSHQLSPIIKLEQKGKEIVGPIQFQLWVKSYSYNGSQFSYSIKNLQDKNRMKVGELNSIIISMDSTQWPNGSYFKLHYQ